MFTMVMLMVIIVVFSKDINVDEPVGITVNIKIVKATRER